jgi:hypothetical protein
VSQQSRAKIENELAESFLFEKKEGMLEMSPLRAGNKSQLPFANY